jgi:hypothetical protein
VIPKDNFRLSHYKGSDGLTRPLISQPFLNQPLMTFKQGKKKKPEQDTITSQKKKKKRKSNKQDLKTR